MIDMLSCPVWAGGCDERKEFMKKTFGCLYYKYQEYLYRNDFYLKNTMFAPIGTKLIIYLPKHDMPLIGENDQLEFVSSRYSIILYSVLEMLKQPISSSYKDEILSWLISG